MIVDDRGYAPRKALPYDEILAALQDSVSYIDHNYFFLEKGQFFKSLYYLDDINVAL